MTSHVQQLLQPQPVALPLRRSVLLVWESSFAYSLLALVQPQRASVVYTVGSVVFSASFCYSIFAIDGQNWDLFISPSSFILFILNRFHNTSMALHCSSLARIDYTQEWAMRLYYNP